MTGLLQEALAMLFSFVVQWLGSYDFYFVEKECACRELCSIYRSLCPDITLLYRVSDTQKMQHTHTNI